MLKGREVVLATGGREVIEAFVAFSAVVNTGLALIVFVCVRRAVAVGTALGEAVRYVTLALRDVETFCS